jgi:hypothetical protein
MRIPTIAIIIIIVVVVVVLVVIHNQTTKGGWIHVGQSCSHHDRDGNAKDAALGGRFSITLRVEFDIMGGQAGGRSSIEFTLGSSSISRGVGRLGSISISIGISMIHSSILGIEGIGGSRFVVEAVVSPIDIPSDRISVEAVAAAMEPLVVVAVAVAVAVVIAIVVTGLFEGSRGSRLFEALRVAGPTETGRWIHSSPGRVVVGGGGITCSTGRLLFGGATTNGSKAVLVGGNHPHFF